MFDIRFTKEAKKDIEKLTPKFKKKLHEILVNIIATNPYQGKKLIGDLTGFYSYRLNLKDRIVYSADDGLKVVYVHRARTHYGN